MNLAPIIHTLLLAALLVPFIALSLLVIAASFGVAWRAGKTKR